MAQFSLQGDLLETEVLILGSGIAGCTTALSLADAGVAVTVVTRARAPEDTNTYWAQGGIIYAGVDDSPAKLATDVLAAGAHHAHAPAVEVLATDGPSAVRRILLERVGVAFDRNPDGSLSLALEGGHTIPRIIHAADATGKAIQLALLNALRAHPNICLLTQHTAIDLLTPAHHSQNRLTVYAPQSCVGAYLFDQQGQRVIRCLAKKTVIATGGVGQIYLRTTNPVGARGDGVAMANRAGVRIINAEFVQFHPTAFYQDGAPSFLITEAVRGAGARIVDRHGTPFMHKYDTQWGDLAPRDVVARSVHREMLRNDLTHVYLDLHSYVSQDEICNHFPTIRERCLQYGVDITKELVPIVPAAHYFCGGIWVDAHGLTNHQHLYAVGEVACTGIHGANRLASTSLLEGLVWGERAAQHIGQTLASTASPPAAEIPPWDDDGTEEADPTLISQDMLSIQQLMWNYVGLVRTTARLARARRELGRLELEIEQFYRTTRLSDELLGLRNATRTALVVTKAAWQNKQSMGCHWRE